MEVKTRFAPSPTGYLHIGGARTALFSWLYARHYGGKFVLRIEDTDLERSTAESIDAILQGMEWLGLDYDEGPFFQTQRFDRYHAAIEQLLDEDKAYYCYCSKEELDAMREAQIKAKQKPRYDGRYRDYKGPVPSGVKPVVRFKNPLDGEVVINDEVKGRVVVKNQELDDLIIARSDGSPTYNLTVVLDDLDMQISHVIRGDDHLNNTPRQINLIHAMAQTPPIYAHVPMILGHDGKRLSKRHGAVSVMKYRDEGYLPEALLNYLVRLGWSHGDQEIFSMSEMIELFGLEAANKAASTFDIDKLQWLNQHYIKECSPQRLTKAAKPYFVNAGIPSPDEQILSKVVEAQRERAKTLSELAESSRFFFEEFSDYDEKAAKKNFKEAALEPLQQLSARFEALETWQASSIHNTIEQYVEQSGLKLGKVAQPIRVAVSGTSVSPPIDVTLEALGKEVTLTRIQRAIAYIQDRVEAAQE